MPVANQLNIFAYHDCEAGTLCGGIDYPVGLFTFEAVVLDSWVHNGLEGRLAVGHVTYRLNRQHAVMCEHHVTLNEGVTVLKPNRAMCRPSEMDDTGVGLGHLL